MSLSSDLSIVKSVNNAAPSIGGGVLFTITVTNDGPSDDTGVFVTDTILNGYTIDTVTPSAGTTWSSPIWTIGNLANGDSATLMIACTVLPNGTYSNTGIVTGNNTDPNPANNTSSVSVVPVAAPVFVSVVPVSGSARIKRLLQIANCCAQKQGQLSIDAKEKGRNDCGKLLAEASLMTNLIDSICGFVPEGEVIGGSQANVKMTIAQTSTAFRSANGLSIGSISYSYTYPNVFDPPSIKAIQFANYINSFYPANYPYYATIDNSDPSSPVVVVSGLNYDQDNGIAGVASGTSYLPYHLPFPIYIGSSATIHLSGGTPPVYQGKNAITNEEVEVILDKLNSLCKIPCGKIFSSN